MSSAGGTPEATGGDVAESASSSRYELLVKIASGGMATVYVGRVRGPAGFSRMVAIKRAHPHLLEDPTHVRMLIDEAMLASKIHHPHVVSVLDVEQTDRRGGNTELRLVLDYVEGAALSELITSVVEGEHVPPAIVVRVVLDACAGLQAAHELTDDAGERLGIVHRDVSPHNILVGTDGMARLADFGIAKFTQRPGSTTTGSLKGKLGYMAPEYVEHGILDARSDVFGLGVVAWEALAQKKLFRGSNEIETLQNVARASVPALSTVAPWVGPHLDEVLAAALTRNPADRFSSARAFGNALEAEARLHGLVATHAQVSAFVRKATKESLERRKEQIRERTRLIEAGVNASTLRTEETAKALRDAVASADGAAAQTPPPAAQTTADFEPLPPVSEGTLDGSGISSVGVRRLGADEPPPSIPMQSVGAGRIAVIVGVIALLGAGGLTYSRVTTGRDTDAPAPMRPTSSSEMVEPSSTGVGAPSLPKTASSTDVAKSTSGTPSATASASASAIPRAQGATQPLPRPRAPVAPNAPNPYGTTPRP